MVRIKTQSFPNAHLCVASREDNCQRIIASALKKHSLAKLSLSFKVFFCWRQYGYNSFCQRGPTCVGKSSNFCDFCQRSENLRWQKDFCQRKFSLHRQIGSGKVQFVVVFGGSYFMTLHALEDLSEIFAFIVLISF